MSYVTGPSGAAGPLSVAPTGTLTATSIATAGLAVSGAGAFAANVSCANLQCNGWLTGNGALLTGITGAVTVNASIEANGIASRLTNKWSNSYVLSNYVLNAVAWSPTLKIFAAVGNGGASSGDSFFSSPDGLSWTPQMMGSVSQWYGVAWGDNKFVAVGQIGPPFPPTYTTATSVDGTNWVIETMTGLGATIGLTGIVWSPDQSQFVAVSSGIYYKGSAVSTDGINWVYNNAAPASTYWWSCLVWAASLGKYVAISTTNQVMTSPDGQLWTLTATLSSGVTSNTLVWSPHLSLLVAFGPSTVFTSNDGVSWSTKSTNTPPTNPVQGATAAMWVPDNGGYFVTLSTPSLGSIKVGLNAVSGAVSTDAQTWVPFYDPNVSAGVNYQGTGSLGYSPSLQRLIFVSMAMGAANVNGSASDTYVSNTSGFLGVGTSSPQQALDVGGYVRTQQPAFLAIGTETASVSAANMSFSNALSNVGNAYSAGFFTCLSNGVHTFAASANVSSGAELVLNKTGNTSLTLCRVTNTSSTNAYVSVMVTSPFTALDKVSVASTGTGVCDAGSTFSGAMLYAT